MEVFKIMEKTLEREFEEIKKQIIVQNYKTIMFGRIIPFVRDEAITQGYLKTDEQVFEEAQERFCQAKKDGRIDELNSLVTF
jgi:aminopeptidase C